MAQLRRKKLNKDEIIDLVIRWQEEQKTRLTNGLGYSSRAHQPLRDEAWADLFARILDHLPIPDDLEIEIEIPE